jgi:hypothetical protein
MTSVLVIDIPWSLDDTSLLRGLSDFGLLYHLVFYIVHRRKFVLEESEEVKGRPWGTWNRQGRVYVHLDTSWSVSYSHVYFRRRTHVVPLH